MNTKLNQTAKSTILRTALIAAGLLGSMLMAGPATAASACKGLDNLECSSNQACGWVEGYVRKDGRTVKSFCRSKPVKRSLSEASKGESKVPNSEASVASK